MICSRCAWRLRPSALPHPPTRALQGRRQRLNTLANARPGPHANHAGPPAATSTSAAQPFTTPLTPAGSSDHKSAAAASSLEPRSSVPAGTPLEGLNYLKNKQAPLALEDHEYPDWLWTLLDTSGQTAASGTAQAEGDAYGMENSLEWPAVFLLCV